MNFIHKNLVAGAAFLLFGVVGCSTPQGTREDYFGYNNRPVVEEEEYTPPPAAPLKTKTWNNPLAEAPQPAVVYYEPVFVPVTAPWWDRYYGWEDYQHSHVVVMYPHHRIRYYDWDYYSYAGYPYYSGYPYYDRPYHNYPVSREIQPVEEKKTSRRIGSSRGTVNRDSEKDTRGGSDNSGWNVRRRGETTPSPSSERSGETTSQPSRSRSTGVTSRGSSSTTSSKKEEKEKSSTTSTSKKSDSGSSQKSEPATSTTKETKSKARGRGE